MKRVTITPLQTWATHMRARFCRSEMYQVVHDKEAEILERETYKNIETGRTINKKCMKIY